MHIAVCIKQILDPEIPPRDFRLNATSTAPEPGKAAYVISPFDENALEIALQIKEQHPDCRITVISVGPSRVKDALRKALAMGCDAAVQLTDPRFEALDSIGTAQVLAATLQRLGAVDLVLCGRQAGDWDAGQVGGLLAEILELPSVHFVPRIQWTGSAFHLERELPDGMETLEAEAPLLATITNADGNQPRLPKVRDIMQAQRKPLELLDADMLGIDPESLAPWTETVSLALAERQNSCAMVAGDDPSELAANLLADLRRRKILA